jgi:hypothetical protein
LNPQGLYHEGFSSRKAATRKGKRFAKAKIKSKKAESKRQPEAVRIRESGLPLY